jgi:NAD(P)-dependent dehydrogenase (short-subunit alcohol dehydrogenase family)
MQTSGKVIVVTGGGNGIGREVVLALLAKGARVAAVDMSDTGLAETASLAAAGDRLSTHVCNLTDRDAVAGLPHAVDEKHGSVDALINVAGIIQPFVKVNDLDFDAIDRVMDVNFFGLVNITKAFLPVLLARPEAHLVNVSSMGAYAPVPGQTIYGASKAAVQLFTEGLHSELLDTNVHVTTVFPGAIATHIAVNSGIMTEEQEKQQATSSQTKAMKTTPAPVAAATLIAGMERNAYRVFIGSDAKTMDRLRRLMPKRAAKLIFDNMKSLLV